MQTGNHTTVGLRNQTANLFSDLLVHNMGVLGDGISQGGAGPNEFRTAPLWGVGQRIHFLHDGRTSDLLQAIAAHANNGADTGSEAVQVITNFNGLTALAEAGPAEFPAIALVECVKKNDGGGLWGGLFRPRTRFLAGPAGQKAGCG